MPSKMTTTIEETVALLDRITRGSNGQPGLVAQIARLGSIVDELCARNDRVEQKLDDIAEIVGDMKVTLARYMEGTSERMSSWERFRDRFFYPIVASVATAAIVSALTATIR